MGIIEKLIKKGFLTREGTGKTKNLIPTEKGWALSAVMPKEIQSPAMTADWEQKRLQIERGELEPEILCMRSNRWSPPWSKPARR